jgi:large subunit ribosomal protein L23
MNVLLAPHVTEKTSLAMQNGNQYTFRVRRDATKPEIKAAVELMFEVKVDGVQVVNEPGKTRASARRLAARRTGRRPTCVSLPARRSITKRLSPHGPLSKELMALIKLKPTSPGTRLRRPRRQVAPAQGRPARAADVEQAKTGGRNHHGRITTRHKGGGSQAASTASSTSSATRTASRASSSASNTIRTAPRTSRW